jgi:hypothetical protein
MATWASTNFTGGSIGAAVTTTTEPIFSLKSGADLVYATGIGGTGQAAQSGATTNGDLTLNLTGKTHIRIAVDVQRVSGTITAGALFILFRVGASTVNQVDCILRNANGGNWALRNNFVYIGQSSRVYATGDVEHIEMEWQQGVGATLALWHPGNNTATPNETWTTTFTTMHDNVRIGNSTGNTGVSFKWGKFRATDGEQYRKPGQTWTSARYGTSVVSSIRYGAATVWSAS